MKNIFAHLPVAFGLIIFLWLYQGGQKPGFFKKKTWVIGFLGFSSCFLGFSGFFQGFWVFLIFYILGISKYVKSGRTSLVNVEQCEKSFIIPKILIASDSIDIFSTDGSIR